MTQGYRGCLTLVVSLKLQGQEAAASLQQTRSLQALLFASRSLRQAVGKLRLGAALLVELAL